MSTAEFDFEFGRLALFTPACGAPSETFINRHIRGIAPGRTVVLSHYDVAPDKATWQVDTPRLLLGRLTAADFKRGLLDFLAIRAGIMPKQQAQAGAVRKFLRRHGVQVFLGEYLDQSLPFLKIARELGVRFFVHAHGYDLSQTYRDPAWRALYAQYRDADGIITVNRIQKERLEVLGVDGEKIHVVPCGVKVPAVLKPKSDSGSVIRCLAVGRMVPKKAPLLLLEAFRRALELCPELTLDYVGGGPLFDSALDYVRRYQLTGRVFLHGLQPVQNVHSQMNQADIFLQHSVIDEAGDEEGLPVAIVEAMAAGLPVVATRHAGIPEAVCEGESGFLVPEGDVVSMATRIAELATDSGLRRSMGLAGWQRARENFSAEGEIAALRRILFFDLGGFRLET